MGIKGSGLKSQVWALADQGKTVHEIAAILGRTRADVSPRFSEWRKQHANGQPDWTEKLLRWHEAALGELAKGVGASVAEVRAVIAAHMAGTAQPEPIQASAIAVEPEPAEVVVPGLPEPARVPPHRPRLYGLMALDGQWLSKTGSFTDDPHQAWRGFARDVADARAKHRNARFCKSAEFPTEHLS